MSNNYIIDNNYNDNITFLKSMLTVVQFKISYFIVIVWIYALKVTFYKEKLRFIKDLRISFPNFLMEIAYFSVIKGPKDPKDP